MVPAPASNITTQPPLSTVHPSNSTLQHYIVMKYSIGPFFIAVDDSEDDLMAEDVRYLEVSDEVCWHV